MSADEDSQKHQQNQQTYRVSVANVGRVVDCRMDQTILDAAIVAGIDYPYACASGNCATCVSHLDAGRVTHLARSDTSLSPEHAKAGRILACRAQPKSDVTLTWLGRGRR